MIVAINPSTRERQLSPSKTKIIILKMQKNRFAPFVLVFFILTAISFYSHAQEIDLLLKGGHVIDPKNGIDGKKDVAIKDGKIFAVSDNISSGNAKKVIDAKGLYVTPGIIDMHAHVYYGHEPGSWLANGSSAVQVDAFSFRSGVTTVVDAGSSGWRNFRHFKEEIIDKVQTRVLAFLNIQGGGMYSPYDEQNEMDMNPKMTALMIKNMFPDILVGIKSPHFWGTFTQVDKAEEAGREANVPVMVDFGSHYPPNSIKDLFFKHFRPGDIFTHTFSQLPQEPGKATRESIVDEASGILKPFVLEAQERGIIFDVGHGAGAFSWTQAVPAYQQGFKPNTISTDLYAFSMNAGMKDMSNVMSKFLTLGMPLKEVILRSTWNPAQVIKHPELGNLSIGNVADVTVFNMMEGDFGFTDVRKLKLRGHKKLVAELTILKGNIMWDLNGISVPEYVKPSSYK